MKIPEALRLGLLAFAEEVMKQRPPDFTAGDNYLRRWRLAEYGQGANAYIHEFTGPDEDGALHNHPYDNVSVVLKTGYVEHFHEEPRRVENNKYVTYAVERLPGEVIDRKAHVFHRLSLINDTPAVSLFLPGPRYQEWGFECVSGFIHFKKFLTPNGGRVDCP
jgi:hypothetical protein